MRPATITVLGQPFTVEYVDPSTELSTEHNQGRMRLAQLRILVDSRQAEPQMRDTVLHELLHACLHIQEPAAEDEAFVARMAPVLLDALRSNPVLVAYLLA